MDIKFQVNKIINSGGDVSDWLDFISQLKKVHIDRDLLLQIHTVALKHVKNEASVGYKKLMIGLANLHSERSTEEAREMFLDAKYLDPECAVVRVYYAQFEYLQQNKGKARQILQNAKQSGCVPKSILRSANLNLRENKLSLLDGLSDPWSMSRATRQSQTDDSSENLNKEYHTLLHTDLSVKAKMLPPPTRSRATTKSKSESSIGGNSKLNTPQGNKKQKSGNAGTSACSNAEVKSVDSSINGNKNKKNVSQGRRGPGMSPFMRFKYSPLVKRDLDIDLSEDGLFSLSAEKRPHIKPIEHFSISSGQFGSENDVSSTDNKKECIQMFNRRDMRKSVSSPCLLMRSCKKSSNEDVAILPDNIIKNISKMDIKSNAEEKMLNNKVHQYMPVVNVLNKPDLKVNNNGHEGNQHVLYDNSKRNSESKLLANAKITSQNYVLYSENDKNMKHQLTASQNDCLLKSKAIDTDIAKADDVNKVVQSMKHVCSRQVLQPVDVNKLKVSESSEIGIQKSMNNLNKENVINKKYINNVNKNVPDCVPDVPVYLGIDPSISVSDGNKRTPYTVKGVCYYQKKVLGRGGSCKVYEVVSQDGKCYALKKVRLHNVENDMLEMYKNEIKWLEKLQGDRHIIRLYNWEVVNNNIFLVLEKGEQDLSHILKNRTLSKEDMKEYWRQMINAVNIIHKVGIVHSDLKPANFLLVGNMLKLIDFGIANCIQDNKTSVTRNCQMGTLNYMSPEALTQDHCRISRASDVWSLGCILYYMAYKKTPYSDIKNQYSRFFAVQQGKPIVYGIADPLLIDCLQGCLKHDRKERYSIQQLLDHSYLN